MKRDSTGHVEYPWDWLLLERMLSSLESYRSHLKHAFSHRLWNDLLNRFSWLNEYLVPPHLTVDGLFQTKRYPQRTQMAQRKRRNIALIIFSLYPSVFSVSSVDFISFRIILQQLLGGPRLSAVVPNIL